MQASKMKFLLILIILISFLLIVYVIKVSEKRMEAIEAEASQGK